MSNKTNNAKVLEQNKNFSSKNLDINHNTINTVDTKSDLQNQLNILRIENNQLKNQLIDKETIITDLQTEVTKQKELINYLNNVLYGKKSEKLRRTFNEEMPLFDAMNCSLNPNASPEDIDNTLEQEEAIQKKDCESASTSTSTTIKKRAVNKQKYSAEELERIYIYLRDKEAEAQGKVPCGMEKTERIATRLKYYIKVICRIKYADKNNPLAGIVTAPLLENSLYTISGRTQYDSSFVADITYDKVRNGMSLYRVVDTCKTQGLDISYSTANYLFHYGAEQLRPIHDLITEKFSKSCNIAHGDETYIKLLEPGGCKQAYMWVKSSVDGCGPQYVIFKFSTNRSAQNALELHSDTCEYLLKDGYDGYNILATERAIELCACWAHVRRKFFNVDKGGNLSEPYLSLIGQMYSYEEKAKKEVKENDFKEILWEKLKEYRSQHTKALVEKFFDLCKQHVKENRILTDSLGKAVTYALNLKDELIKFLDNPRVPMDNNNIEREIRKFVTGRKNWLFVASEKSGEQLAIHMTLMLSCLACGVNYRKWLEDVLEKVSITPRDQLENLLPDNWVEPKAVRTYSYPDKIYDPNHKVTTKDLREYIKNNPITA